MTSTAILSLSDRQAKKILVIEDEPTIRRVLGKILANEGFSVLAAETGTLGVEMAFKELPDLIICDIMLPNLDGYGVLSQLRQNSATAGIPFIFLTAKDERSALRLGMQLGADDYLTKPFTKAELLEAIATRFAKQEAIRQQYTTALEQATEKLNKLIYYDSLTHLPNRLLLQDWFEQTRQQEERKQKLRMPILTLTINQFERLEEILGTSRVDGLLSAVANRLTSCMEKGSIVARLNTAQFAIILLKSDSEYFKEKLLIESQVKQILDTLSLPLMLDAEELFITSSIGIAIYPQDGRSLNLLLKYSLAAMNQAKQKGGNSYQFYTANLLSKSTRSLALETSLRYALKREELQVYYQPKVNVKTRAIVGAEALLRWHHPMRGIVSPAEFIPIAEETGLILPIGQWVLHRACQQLKRWQAAGFSLSISVNVSAHQFNEPDLSKMVFQTLKSVNLETKWLDLELTESMLVQDPASAIATLNELKNLGVQISIDDFGTGYSSLSYLKQFPFDNLKIDQGFVRNLTHDSKNAAITTALIQLAHSLSLKVIAEGVETEAELAFLSQHQCDEIQGYLFGAPVPASDFELLLANG